MPYLIDIPTASERLNPINPRQTKCSLGLLSSATLRPGETRFQKPTNPHYIIKSYYSHTTLKSDKKTMKRSITVLLMLLVGTLCFAQNTAKQTPSKTITGTVTDARTGETLIGATIYDTISHKGTVTNQHG